MTGQVLGNTMRKKGYTVSELQKKLNLSCPQPIYRWLKGKTLPSVDNLYLLSTILREHMEELLMPRTNDAWVNVPDTDNEDWDGRVKIYYGVGRALWMIRIKS
ncbi:MAG: helix-turn-helix domain-containing protein, partial [Lachnospiraceae bacterium]|nr:helix-turn-helix domain-containing protein [Lachnospiraceae bacterium]